MDLLTPRRGPLSARPGRCRALRRRSLHYALQTSIIRTYALASRLRASWMEARVTKVARVSVRFSKSLTRRRLRPNQEKVRSTTQRRGSTTKPFLSSLRLTYSAQKHDLPHDFRDCRPKPASACSVTVTPQQPQGTSAGNFCRELLRLRDPSLLQPVVQCLNTRLHQRIGVRQLFFVQVAYALNRISAKFLVISLNAARTSGCSCRPR